MVWTITVKKNWGGGKNVYRSVKNYGFQSFYDCIKTTFMDRSILECLTFEKELTLGKNQLYEAIMLTFESQKNN
jgi:hypothetical protein